MLLAVLPAQEWSSLIDCDPWSLSGELPVLQQSRLAERLQQAGFDTAGRIWCEYDPDTQSLTFRQGQLSAPMIRKLPSHSSATCDALLPLRPRQS